jgi:hypothetical protein
MKHSAWRDKDVNPSPNPQKIKQKPTLLQKMGRRYLTDRVQKALVESQIPKQSSRLLWGTRVYRAVWPIFRKADLELILEEIPKCHGHWLGEHHAATITYFGHVRCGVNFGQMRALSYFFLLIANMHTR